MTRIKHMNYSRFDLTRVSMQAGDTYGFSGADADKCIALITTQGGAYSTDPEDKRRYPAAGEPIHYNGTNNADVNMKADVDTEWVCISANATGERPSLELATVQGDSALAAGTGIIVVAGSISLDGIAGGPDACFRPRPGAVTLSGSGQVILVRSP